MKFMDSVNRQALSATIRHMLDAFDWEASPQGFTYWNEVHKNLKELIPKNSSGKLNITWYKPLSKWRLVVTVAGKNRHVGYFDTVEQAELAKENYYGGLR